MGKIIVMIKICVRTFLAVSTLAILVMVLSSCLSKPTVVPSPEGQIVVKQSGGAGIVEER